MSIFEALAGLSYGDCSVPVSHPPHVASAGDEADAYIEVRHLGQTGTIYAEGKERATGVMYAVTLYYLAYDEALIREVKRRLEKGGWLVTFDGEDYNGEQKLGLVSWVAMRAGGEYG